jgi:predicted ABC-type ATPase
MPARKPTIYLIAGCNGAGKTTFAKEFLLKEVNCTNFLNADYLALGLSPLSPELAAMKAGRLLMAEFRDLVRRKETFALESTLSGKTYILLFRQARKFGYEIELHYLWLSDPAQAIARVRQRVRLGGHDVPAADIRRRFKRGLEHLLKDYLLLATRWVVWDGRDLPAKRIAISAVDSIETVRRLVGL